MRWVISLVIVTVILLISQGAASSPGVSVVSSNANVAKGSIFMVNISVDPAGFETYGAQFDLDYLSSRINATKIENGPFLIQDGAASLIAIQECNNNMSQCSYGESRASVANGVTTPGILVTITFRADVAGVVPLNLSNVILADPSASMIENVMISNGTVTVSDPPVPICGPDKLTCENVGAPVQFNGSASFAPAGIIVSYRWEFGDGTTIEGIAPKHIYTSYHWNGSAYLPFIVNLSVTDNYGTTNMLSQKVVIWMPGDINGDGKVNINDLSLLGIRWGSSDPCADLNNDGSVNIIDVSILGKNWGKTA